LAGHLPCPCAASGAPPAEVLLDNTHARRIAAPPEENRTTKTHALSDDQGRRLRFVLAGGQVTDCRVADHFVFPPIPSYSRIRLTTPTPYAVRSKNPAQSPIFQPGPTALGIAASFLSFTAGAMPSSAHVRTHQGLSPDCDTRYDKNSTNFLAAVSPLLSSTGYESGP